MARKQGDGPVCPLCGGRHANAKVRALVGEEPLRAPLRGIPWACDDCLAEGRALIGHPLRQNAGLLPPFLVYADLTRRCHDCDEDFVFSASEQRYWYETLQFIHESVPLQCRPCRIARRRRKELRAELAEALASLDPTDVKALTGLSRIYRELGLVRKSAEYASRARNQSR